jgi:hypothetical protein
MLAYERPLPYMSLARSESKLYKAAQLTQFRVKCDPGEALMAEKTLVHQKRSFKSQSRGRLIGALLIVAVAVACLVVAAVSPPPGITFIIVWVLVWGLFALFGIRLARMATQVHSDRLVIRGLFRTRRIHANRVSKIVLVRRRDRQYAIDFWMVMAELRSGGRARLWGLGQAGSPKQEPPELAAAAAEITALLREHMNVSG